MPLFQRILPSYYLYPILFFIPTGYVILARRIFESSAYVQYLGKDWAFISALFLQFCEFCFIGVCQYWLYRLFVHKLHFPALLLNVFCIPLYLECFGFGLYDFENGRHNMQMVLVSHYHAYLGRYGMRELQRNPPLSTVIGLRSGQSSAAQVAGMTILDSPGFWISVIVVLVIWLMYVIYLVIRFWDNVKLSTLVKINPGKEMPSETMLMQSRVLQQTWIPRYRYQNPFFITYHVLAAIDLIYLAFVLFVADEKTKYIPYMPYSHELFLTLTHFEQYPANPTQITNISRGFLPDNRYWLDQRPDPVYPAVHGDLHAFCAYNPSDSKCQHLPSSTPEPLLREDEMPNVVTLIWESFTPMAYMMNSTFLDEHTSIDQDDPRTYITNTTYYNTNLLSGVSSLAKNGVTFSGMSSYGVPTLSGWHGFMTGLSPAQTYMNIIDGTNIQSDDFPSIMHDNMGYRTFYVSPARFDFDGKDSWVFRRPAREEAMIRLGCSQMYEDYADDPLQQNLQLIRPAVKECAESDIDELEKRYKSLEIDMPRWWDYLVAYYPLPLQSQYLNISEKTLSTTRAHWVPDRVTAKQFQAHWLQQKAILAKKNKTQPIFATQLTVETHLPYHGYDMPFYYDPIPPTIELHTDEHRAARWIRVNKYTDRYLVQETLDFLRQNDPNTIFVMTGDHSGRDLPVREKRSHLTDQTVFEASCVHESTGPDVFFSTSGIISYLGNDTRIEKALGLDKLAGQTLNFPCDHNDLIYTVLSALSKLSGKPVPPTYRRSRDLIDLSLNISETVKENDGVEKVHKMIDDSGWQSVAAVTFVMEYKNGTRFLRTHPGDPDGAHFYNHSSFPTCVTNVKESEANVEIGSKNAKKMFHDMFRYIGAENYLTVQNRMYNYGFRNQTCIDEARCEFLEPGSPVKFEDTAIIIVIFGFPVLFLLVFAVPAETISCLCQLPRIKETDDFFDSNEFFDANAVAEFKEAKQV